MSIQDSGYVFSDAQEVLSTADATDIVDLGSGEDYLGNTKIPAIQSGKAQLVISIPVAYTGGTSVAFKLQHSTVEGSGYADTGLNVGAIVVATLVAGYVVMRIPLQVLPALNRYLKLVYTVVGSPSTGSIDAYIDFL